MRDSAFTPGPWRAERRKTCSVVLQSNAKQDGRSNRVAECPQWEAWAHPTQPTADIAFANARLMAAAPRMFAALEYARNLIGPDEILDAAIAEARGEQ